MPTAKLTTHWRESARRSLVASVEGVIPSTAAATGLAPVLRLLARKTVDGQPLYVEAVLREAWQMPQQVDQPLSRRLSEARLPSTMRMILMMRVAAIGALVKLGASVSDLAQLVGVKHTSHIYALIGGCESFYNRTPSPRDVLQQMRTAPQGMAFTRYVTPLLPLPTDARWQVPLGARPNLAAPRCQRCARPIVVGADNRRRNADGTLHTC